MFDLVADVERYPEFVPLCRSLRVRKRTAGEGGTEVLVADMTVAYKVMRETFTSRVTLDKPNLKIQVAYLDGPFSHLDNRWSFKPVSETASEVEFFIAYEFKSRVLGMLMGAMFEAGFPPLCRGLRAPRGCRLRAGEYLLAITAQFRGVRDGTRNHNGGRVPRVAFNLEQTCYAD